MTPASRPVRIIHLLGGLRAYSAPGQPVKVGQQNLTYFQFENVDYSMLYQVLSKIGLTPIGVEFVEMQEQISGVHPANFEVLSPTGFENMASRREWTNVATANVREATNHPHVNLARRISTYQRLLSWRLLQISEAYHRMSYEVRTEVERNPTVGKYGFENQWTWELQTTIHGFLSDAATLRDVLAEAVWKLLVRDEQHDVLTMGSLMKKAKNHEDSFVQNFINQGKDCGWLGSLTDIRNETTHVVPLKGLHETFYCFMRETPIQDSSPVMSMHCPLTTGDWELRRGVNREVKWSNDSQAREALKTYNDYVETSGDALEYCWRTICKFAEWAEKLRVEAKLTAKPLTLTDEDLAGATI